MILRLLRGLLKKSQSPAQQNQFDRWFACKGDRTLRVEYDLNSESVVFDLGGFEGDWSSDIFSRYCCKIFIFEPVPAYATNIEKRFSRNPGITIYPIGLSSESILSNLSICADASSIYKKEGRQIKISLVNAMDFIREHGVSHIDLMKINIEGGEYDLLECLIENNFVYNIGNIQVQFHDFIPSAKKRLAEIQKQLKKTHYLTYEFPFVWENWCKRDKS